MCILTFAMTTSSLTEVHLRLSRGIVTTWRPTRDEVLNLQVGDLAPSCFGRLEHVSSIYGRGDDIHGKAYVCYYTRSATGLTVSNSLKEGQVSRDVNTTRFGTSAEISAHDLK